MEETAVPAPPCDIESCYDESEWETMKMLKAAEEKYANIVIVTFPGLLKALHTKLTEIESLPKTEENALIEDAKKQQIRDLTAEYNACRKILNEMDMKLTKQLKDFVSGLQKSELYEILTFIPHTYSQTDSGSNRKRSFESISDTQCTLQFD